jgi:hypothetical protein
MDLFGFDAFDTTPLITDAMFTLHDAIPADCTRLRVEFDEQGAALISAFRKDDTESDAVVEPTDDLMGAAGFLHNYISYQVVRLSRQHQKDGDDAVFAAQERLRSSLTEVGLEVGMLDGTLDDSITVIRR